MEFGELRDFIGEEVTVEGWVESLRDIGKVKFIVLRKGMEKLQVVIKGEKAKELERVFKEITLESVVRARGIVKSTKETELGFEVHAQKIEILSRAEKGLPVDVRVLISTYDKQLDWRPLTLRNPRNQAIFRIKSAFIKGALDWLLSQGFILVQTPSIMALGSEGGAEVFSVDYFGKRAYLRQDPQLHRQLTILGGFDKIVELGPSWRAEKSFTTRHISEYNVIAVEMGFIKDEYDVMRVQERMVREALRHVIESCERELELLGVELETPRKAFPVLEFPKVYEILQDLGIECEYLGEIGSEAERALGDYVREEYGHDFFFLNRFPYKTKPFYVMRYPEPLQDFARSTDLVYRGVEVSSGGQREHRYELIVRQAEEKGIARSEVEWFAKHFKYGAPPHGGFAIGIERFLRQMLKLKNVRDASLFPRDVERVVP